MPEIDFAMEAVHFSDKIAGADLILTGEGRIDDTTAHGKTIAGILRAAQKSNAVVVAIAGSIAGDLDELYRMGLAACFSISEGPMDLDESKRRAAELIERASERVTRLFLAARKP